VSRGGFTHRPTVELGTACPYCDYPTTLDVTDIRGELRAIRCIDCKQAFVVDVTVTLAHQVKRLVDVTPDQVLDELSRPRFSFGREGAGADPEPPGGDDSTGFLPGNNPGNKQGKTAGADGKRRAPKRWTMEGTRY